MFVDSEMGFCLFETLVSSLVMFKTFKRMSEIILIGVFLIPGTIGGFSVTMSRGKLSTNLPEIHF